jgi:CheY-like chemotaxis protein
MIRKVLLVDDEADIRKIASLALSRLGGWEVLQASSGREALGVAAAERPDVILLDVMMPEMDGPATLEALRAAPATSGIPVVFLTAKIQAPERERIATLGAAGIIAKPFDVMRLAADVQRIVARHEEVRAAARELARELAVTLPDRAGELAEAFGRARAAPESDEARDAVRRVAHRLRGTAGSHGFAAIGAAAASIEDALLAGRPDDATWTALAAHVARVHDEAARAAQEARA